MYVLSVKGVSKGFKGFYYVSVSDKIKFIPNYEESIKFERVEDCIDWVKENYTDLLQSMLETNGKLFSDTFAIRKINFKTVKFINSDILKEENTNADESNEVSDNGIESEAGVEV